MFIGSSHLPTQKFKLAPANSVYHKLIFSCMLAPTEFPMPTHQNQPDLRFQQWVSCGQLLRKTFVSKIPFLLCYNPLKLYCAAPWNLKARVGRQDDFNCKPKGSYKEIPSIKKGDWGEMVFIIQWTKIYKGWRSPSKRRKALRSSFISQ